MDVRYLLSGLAAVAIVACSEKPEPVRPPQQEPQPEVDTEIVWDEGVRYVWDDTYIPEITIEVSVEQWNNLLKAYDKNPHTEDYVRCRVKYDRG